MKLHAHTGIRGARRVITGLLITVALLLVAMVAVLGTPAPDASADASPAPATTRQIIAVNAPTAGSTTGTLTAWARGSDGIWRIAIGPVSAHVGSRGIGRASEGSGRTPAGTYALTQAFGRQPNPGTRLRYFQTDPLDWWDENPSSRTYNLHVRRVGNPGGASENLYHSGQVYDYAVNMDYNLARVPGAGSAFFLHVTNGRPTAGCVAVSSATMVAILRWLDPAQHPIIYNKVGAAWKPPSPTGPVGRVEVMAPVGSRQVDIAGWAVDPAAPGTAMTIRVRVYGPQPLQTTYATTRMARPDIARSFWWAGPNSGFHLHVASTVGMKWICVDEIITAQDKAGRVRNVQVKNMVCHHIRFR